MLSAQGFELTLVPQKWLLLDIRWDFLVGSVNQSGPSSVYPVVYLNPAKTQAFKPPFQVF